MILRATAPDGYSGAIHLLIGIHADGRLAGVRVLGHRETPGLGARIDDPAWQARWRGKRVAGPDGQLRLSVVRGGGTDEFQVEGITGATRTGNAINNGIQFWLGPDGFGPVLERLAKDGR